MIRYIIFDMDGVLVDSEAVIRDACIQMFKRRGITVQPDDFISFTGVGEGNCIAGISQKYGHEFAPDMKAEAYRIYGEIAKEQVIVCDGVKDMVGALRACGYKLAVASAADSVKVNINLECLGLSQADFDGVVTGNDVTKHKPDPEAFLKACAKIGGNPPESVVIEDALSGCKAAKAAGMACIGIMSTFSAEELRQAGADFTAGQTRDVPGIIARMNSTGG